MESGILNRGGTRSAKFTNEEKFRAFVDALRSDGKDVEIEECTVEDCEVWDL